MRTSKRVTEPLAWLVAHQAFPDALAPVAEAAWARARQLPLVRCMDGNWRSPDQAKIGPPGYSNYLPKRLFGQLALVSEPALEELLRKNLKVNALESKEILTTLLAADLTVIERAKAIAGIARSPPEDFHDSRLLIDSQGKRMPSTVTAFPPPTDELKRQNLPPWANTRFIHPDLWAELSRLVAGNALRDKLHSLKGFRIAEYSADAVITALRSRVTELLEKGKGDPDWVDPDFLQADLLAYVYSFHDRNRNRPPGTFRVRCQDGEWRDISTVHLSETYNQPGRITAALYSGRPEALIGTAASNGLDKAGDNAVGFLEWLGINRWPRGVTEKLPQKWWKTVIDDLPEKFTVTNGGKTFREIRRENLEWDRTASAEHHTVEALDHILTSASSEAILAWIAHDDRLDPLAPSGPFCVKLSARDSANAHYWPYAGNLPSTLRREIESRAWLECSDGQRRAPTEIMIEPRLLSSLFHAPRAFGAAEEAFGLIRDYWQRGLERAGVVKTLDDLSEPQVYRLLSSLPERNVKPEVGSRLFLQVLERDSFDHQMGGAEGIAFLKSGMLPIQFGGERIWAGRDKVHYAQRDDLPSAARSHLRLIDLPTRLNGTQVFDRFGVPALKKDALDLRVITIDEIPDADASNLRAQFERAKPYILALRKTLSTNRTPLRRFEGLDLHVARGVKMQLSINHETVVEELELEHWHHQLSQDSLLITINDTADYEVTMALGSQAIANGLAELFELQSGADFVPYLTAYTDSLRRTLLQRALSSMDTDELDSLIGGVERFSDSLFASKVDSKTLLGGPSLSSAKSSAQADSSSDKAGSIAEIIASDKAEKDGAPKDVELSIEPRPVPSNMPGTGTGALPRTLRVAAPTGRIASQSDADPERAADAEHWTKAFEIKAGRWPFSVAHLQGSGAFGCDYLSFKTEDDLETFKANPARIELVSRFIETKSGRVLFTDNEWIAASKHGERYFVYRVTFVSAGRDLAELTVVHNPLSRTTAIRTERELVVDKVPDREIFGLSQASAADQVLFTHEPVAEPNPEAALTEV